MAIRTILLLMLAAVAMATSGCQSPKSSSRADSPWISNTQKAPAPVSDVFAQAGIEHVTNAVLMAWTANLQQVVVTGQCGNTHIAAVAYRHPYSPDHLWRVRYIRFRMTDGRCLWDFAKDEYDHPPTRDDIAALLRRVHAKQAVQDFSFAESAQ